MMFRDGDSAALASHSGETSLLLHNNTQTPCLPGVLRFWECQSHLYVSIKREPQAWNILFYFFPFIFLKQPVSENLYGQTIKRLQLGFGRSPSLLNSRRMLGWEALFSLTGSFI